MTFTSVVSVLSTVMYDISSLFEWSPFFEADGGRALFGLPPIDELGDRRNGTGDDSSMEPLVNDKLFPIESCRFSRSSTDFLL